MSLWDKMLIAGHVSVIHFPVIGIVMGFVAAATTLVIGILKDVYDDRPWFTKEVKARFERYMDRFEFTSFVMILMGEFGLIIAGITGVKSAGSLEYSINNDLLEYKVRLSMYLFFILLTPLFLKAYFGLVLRKNVFTNQSKIIPLLYLGPLVISAILTVLISSAGGQYVYGESYLDLVGLGGLLPD